MKSIHQQLRDLLTQDERLNAEQQAHLATCDDCARYARLLADLREGTWDVGAIIVDPLTPSEQRAVVRAIRPHVRENMLFRRSKYGRLAGIAGAVALGLFMMTLYFSTFDFGSFVGREGEENVTQQSELRGATRNVTTDPFAVLQDTTAFTQVTLIEQPKMLHERAAHTATLLPDGRVLLTGGFAGNEQALNSTELFDPVAQTFSPAPTLAVGRMSHSATLLPDGRVLIAGGFNGDYLASAEIYDPQTNSFTSAGSMLTGRSGHVAVLLNDGKVLVAGGTGEGWSFLQSAEIYDPQTNTFSATGAMSVPRESHTATLLTDGSVLITGGHQGRRSAIELYASAELYEPASGTFTLTGSMSVKRHKHDAVRLADGRVLITGGADERDAGGVYDSTEIFDPSTGEFSDSDTLNSSRYKHYGTSLLLSNGQAALFGGANRVELRNLNEATFYTPSGDGIATRFFATATRLNNGDVLIAGGYGASVSADKQAWVLRFE